MLQMEKNKMPPDDIEEGKHFRKAREKKLVKLVQYSGFKIGRRRTFSWNQSIALGNSEESAIKSDFL